MKHFKKQRNHVRYAFFISVTSSVLKDISKNKDLHLESTLQVSFLKTF